MPTLGEVWSTLLPGIGRGFLRSLYPQFSLLQCIQSVKYIRCVNVCKGLIILKATNASRILPRKLYLGVGQSSFAILPRACRSCYLVSLAISCPAASLIYLLKCSWPHHFNSNIDFNPRCCFHHNKLLSPGLLQGLKYVQTMLS